MLGLRPFKKCDEAMVFQWITEEKGFYQWFANRVDSLPQTKLEEMSSDYSLFSGDESVIDLVAFDQTGICGFVSMHFADEKKQRICYDLIIIHPNKRGRGYGKKMVSLAIKYAFEMLQAKEISLDVFAVNETAYHCFCAAGFHEITENEKNVVIQGEAWKSRSMEYKAGVVDSEKAEVMVDEGHIIDEIINKNDFRYAFQPIVEASSGEIYGYEALMRADYGGPVAPGVILKHAKAKSRLYDIEKATFYNVLSLVQEQKDQFENRKVFINSIPGYQLTDSDYGYLSKNYRDVLQRTTVEITEETEMIDEELEVLVERSFRDGCGIAIDDYGTGYSNTSSLLRCVPNCIKIDRLLISGIYEETKKQHFVKSIIEFAHDNGILVLAEGVENSAELRTVIEMGVDLIQGFYIARPSFSIPDEIDSNIRNEILNMNVKGQTQTTRRVLFVEDEKELPLVRLTLEKYTGILLGEQEFTLVGNTNYVAAMTIKIKDNCHCKLTLRNVNMESILELPCIEIGKNSHLTLVVEGENRIRKVGICVPEGSSLDIEGDGDLFIRAQGINSYGIGNNWESGVGSILLNSTGKTNIMVEADLGIGIGGGVYRHGEGIRICRGNILLEPASKEVLCIGSVRGSIPIEINKCSLEMVIRSDKGVGIGSIFDDLDIIISEAKVDISGSGSTICGIGSNQAVGGKIAIEESGISAEANGQHLIIAGSAGGRLDLLFRNSSFYVKAEGHQVLGIGTDDDSATIIGYHSDFDITIHSQNYKLLGADEKNIYFDGGRQRMHANE